MTNKKPIVTKFNQKIIDAYEQFIIDVYEACRFVTIGSGKKYNRVFDILLQIINTHEKDMWRKIKDEMSKPENN